MKSAAASPCCDADRANRPAPELEALIGYFINPVALRTHLEGSLSFQQIVQRVKNTVVGAQGNSEVPTPNGAVQYALQALACSALEWL